MLSDKEIIKRFRVSSKEKVLDIGGSMRQRDEIKVHTLVDIIKPEEAPYGTSKLKAKKFVRLDITKEKFPFKDEEFDFCISSHTLEDLNDPTLALSEMQRVSKRGLIITPSMGADLVFSHVDFTDWLTGARRVPGVAHHKWFFEKKRGRVRIVAKNYPILYTSKFHSLGWKGEEELVFYWEGKIDYKIVDDGNPHRLINEYSDFFERNKKRIKKGRALFFIDNPLLYLRELIKLIFKKGEGFKYRS